MNKIKNNVLIKNIIILLVSGGIAKIIGMFGKIIYTRQAGLDIVSMYTLITPTFMLVMTLCQFSLPISISKLAAENKYDDKKLLYSAYKIGFTIDIILMIIIIFICKLVASTLHNIVLYKAILSFVFVIPFVTISSIQRGFLHGKENMLPASITNITEEILKIVLIITTLPIAIAKSDICAVVTIILYNVILEITSIFIMQKSINKYLKKTTKKYKQEKNISNDIISISVPTTSIRLISSIGFFLEPILLTKILVANGYSPSYITLEYGIINSYVIPLLSMPTFFSVSIASALLPNITKAYYKKNYKEFKNKLLKLLFLSIVIGIICLGTILLFPSKILQIVYGINFGINYIYVIGPFFLILYIQPTLSVTIQAMNKTNKLFFVSLTTTLLKFICLITFGLLGFGIYSLVFSIITGIITTTLLDILVILKEIKKRS